MKKLFTKLALAGAMLGLGLSTAQADPLKVGFVYLTNPGDHGWTYAHEVGRQELQAHFGDKVETSYVENVPEGPDAARVIRELAAQGNKVIFTTSFGYMDPTIRVAKEYPNVHFDHITGYKRSANVATDIILKLLFVLIIHIIWIITKLIAVTKICYHLTGKLCKLTLIL